MKKGLVAVVFTAILARVLMQAGMQNELGEKIRNALADGSLLHASISLELGSPAETSTPASAAPSDAPEPMVTTVPLAFFAGEGVESENPEEAVEETAASGGEDEGRDNESDPAIRTTTISGGPLIRNNTEHIIDTAALMAEGLNITLPANSPQILIIHTHSTEAYTPVNGEEYDATDPYRTTDLEYSVVKVGDVLAQALEKQGLIVIHDRGVYDYPSYTGSYSRAGAAVESYLSEYPDIAVVIDLHRDALGDGDVVYKTMAEVKGETASQVMLLVGTGENGLEQPHWRENLKLALAMQNALNKKYPTLARPVTVSPERYNQHLTAGSLLLEVGSSGNSLSEAKCSARLFAEAVGPLLLSLVSK